MGTENYTSTVPRNDDHWYILRLAIPEELLEARVKLDICRIILYCKKKKQFVALCKRRMRTFFKRLFALLKRMSILVDALQHLPKGVSARQMPERTICVSGQRTALRSARIMTQLSQRTGTLRGRRGFPDCLLASFPSHSQENLSCLRHRCSNQLFQGCQHTEKAHSRSSHR